MELDGVFLEKEQRDLLIKIVEAHNSVSREERGDFVFRPSTIRRTGGLTREQINEILSKRQSVLINGKLYREPSHVPHDYDHDTLRHPGLSNGVIDVLQTDIDALASQGFLETKNRASTETTFFLSARSLIYYNSLKQESERTSMALVMKGGGVKGLAYVGALKELEKYYHFDWFIGTSAGAIAAVLLAAGYTTDELELLLSKKNFLDFLDAKPHQLLPNLLFKKGLFPANTFTAWIDRLLAEKLGSPVRVTLGQLPYRATVYASRRGRNALVFDSMDVKTRDIPAAYAVRCSMAIPFIFTPQMDAGLKVLDGGMRNNYPVDVLLRDHPNTKFIGLYLGPEHYEGEERETSLLRDMLSVWTEATDIESLTKFASQTVVIDPRPISTIDFNLTEKEKLFLLKAGKASAMKFVMKTNKEGRPSKNDVNTAYSELAKSKAEVSARRSRRNWIATALLVLLCLSLLGGVVYSISALKQYFSVTHVQPPNLRISSVTTSGNSTTAAISTDGRYVVYAVREQGKESLWLKQVEIPNNRQLINPAETAYVGLTFSPDGNWIYFVRDQNGKSALYKMPALGGEPKKLVENVASSISFSPDGKFFAFIRGEINEGETFLMMANADGTGERTIARGSDPDLFVSSGPAWSPDGEKIACVTRGPAAEGSYLAVITIAVNDGARQQISTKRWRWVDRLAWLADGSGLILSAAEQQGESARWMQIWHLSYPDGNARKITNDLNSYYGLSLTSDSASLVTLQQNGYTKIWVSPISDLRQMKQVTSGKFDGYSGLAWTPDGKIVYASTVSGNQGIWIVDSDGNNAKLLTDEGTQTYNPSVSHDGKYVTFVSNRSGNANVWIMDIDGSNPKQLTFKKEAGFSNCSPVEPWLVYADRDSSGKFTLWRMSLNGSDTAQLTDSTSTVPTISPDGKWIAFYQDEKRWAIIPSNGGPVVKTFDLHHALQWAPDGSSITYVNTVRGVSNIWRQPIEGGTPTKLTDFNTDSISNFAWSRDGKLLACSRSGAISDIVLIRDFR